MNEDEIQLVTRIRPDAAPYDPEAKAAARRGLTAAAASRRAARPRWLRPRTMVPAGALAAAAAVLAVVAVPGGEAPRGPERQAVVASPRVVPVSASEVLGRAARAARTDLAPRDDQFIRVESETMYGAFGDMDAASSGRGETRHLYRTRRVIWKSVDGTREGSLRIEHLEPKAYPGWPIPQDAYEAVGTVDVHRLPVCEIPGHERTDYATLKKLPTDAAGMRAHLYTGNRGGNSRDEGAWGEVGDMLRETYMPAAQRAALFEAAATIPGVEIVGDAQDAAGRTGIAVGRVGPDGVRQDLVFHPETYELLGERGVVVDEKLARAPEGSLVASTAELSVTVADEAPEVDDERSGCMG
ncbi:CU044_5270 family protein [Planomonospora corallina]|uniref:CU044_5270 family protein n=1 Tax=Planomonospora corallina TaxID=1806052 RepID=A0ABV8I8T7_9ACTN